MAVLAVKSLKKLELIGDHRQLPAFVQQCWYNLEITHESIKTSLFERLVEGGLHRRKQSRRRGQHHEDEHSEVPPLTFTVLDEQRRMRTAISDLTRPEYRDIVNIIDHPHTGQQCVGDVVKRSCKDRKQVLYLESHRPLWETKGREIPGILPSVFFWNVAGNKEGRPLAGLSACNPVEANAVAHMTKFLITCGVPPSAITIITPYKGKNYDPYTWICILLHTLYSIYYTKSYIYTPYTMYIGQKTLIIKELRGLRLLPGFKDTLPDPSAIITVSTVDRYQGTYNISIYVNSVCSGV